MDIRVDVHLKSPELTEALASLAAALAGSGLTRAPAADEAARCKQDEDKPISPPDTTADPDEAEEAVPSLEEVRAKLAALSQTGKQEALRALSPEFDGWKLSDGSVDKYP